MLALMRYFPTCKYKHILCRVGVYIYIYYISQTIVLNVLLVIKLLSQIIKLEMQNLLTVSRNGMSLSVSKTVVIYK